MRHRSCVLLAAILAGVAGCPGEDDEDSPAEGGGGENASAGTVGSGSDATGGDAAGGSGEGAGSGTAGQGSEAGTGGAGGNDSGGASGGAAGTGGAGTSDGGGAPGGAAGSGGAGSEGGCAVGGCSSQLCGEAGEDLISTCEYREEYACYRDATCERQSDGRCGWTQTPELEACLETPGGAGSGGGGELRWYSTCGDPVCRPIAPPSGGAGCQSEVEGEACTDEGASCETGQCGVSLVCARTDPKGGFGGCPISRVRYKQDIAYLDEAERAAYYAQIVNLPLATYDYRQAPERGRQLGFLIEDVEASERGRELFRGDQVDLYGYLSMTVAALQVQARQIEALRAQLEANAAPSCQP